MIVLIVCGGVAYRWRGMDEHEFPVLLEPRWTRRLLYAVLLGLACSALGYAALLVPLLAWPGVVVGHGSYFLGGGPKIDNEPFRSLTGLLSSPMNQATKMVGMALTGLTLTVPIGLLVGIADIKVGALVAMCGCLKALAYWVTYRIAPNGPATEWAEYLWGATSVGGVALILQYFSHIDYRISHILFGL